MESFSSDQLLGSTSTSSVDDDCDPLVYNGTLVLHPCGVIANSLFNDIFTVTSNHTMDETNIAWDTDVEDKVGALALKSKVMGAADCPTWFKSK